MTISGHLSALRFPHLAAMAAERALMIKAWEGRVHHDPYVIFVIALIAMPWSLSSLHTPTFAALLATALPLRMRSS